MDPDTRQELKNALEKERNILVAELQTIANPDPKMKGDWDARFPKFEPVETGSHSSLGSAADEVEEYETRLAEEHTLELRLLEVEKALNRIESDAYGNCAKCGRPIPLERLKANPAAEFDIEHSE